MDAGVDTLHKYVQPMMSGNIMHSGSATNEESELAMLKGLRSGKITIQADDDDSTLDAMGGVNNTL